MTKLKEIQPLQSFRLYKSPLNPLFRKESEVYPGEFGDRFCVVTNLKNGKKIVIPETQAVFLSESA